MLTDCFCQTDFRGVMKLRLDTKLYLPTCLSKIEISPQSRRGRREVIFLFGGEPFDRLKALSKVEGKPPNKKPSSKSEPEQA